MKKISKATNVQLKKLESENLREILKSEMADKQTLKRQIAEGQALSQQTTLVIDKQNLELANNERNIAELQLKIASFQKRMEDIQRASTEPDQVADLSEEFKLLNQPLPTVTVSDDSADYRRAKVKEVKKCIFTREVRNN